MRQGVLTLFRFSFLLNFFLSFFPPSSSSDVIIIMYEDCSRPVYSFRCREAVNHSFIRMVNLFTHTYFPAVANPNGTLFETLHSIF